MPYFVLYTGLLVQPLGQSFSGDRDKDPLAAFQVQLHRAGGLMVQPLSRTFTFVKKKTQHFFKQKYGT
jgi:hypothetical protein